MEPTILTPESRFSGRVENYIRFRPGYPSGIAALLQRETGLSPASAVADIGSGTGISTAVLLDTGSTVFAVEPNRGMREAAERLLAGRRGFVSIDGTAENTGLPAHTIDLVTAFQAFHWFKGPATRAEFDRILKPGGRVALIWNVRRPDSTPFLRDYENLLLTYGTDYATIRHENVHGPELLQFFKDGQCAQYSLPNHQICGFEDLKGRLLSCSYIPQESHPAFPAMIRELEQLFARHRVDGRVTIEYGTLVYLGR
ncbi:MAG: class I SAM-dependent methyltransferase [Verrucomicrobiota bacterium]